MAEVDKREKTHQILSSSSSSLSNYPRDLLQRFTTMNQNNHNYYLSFPVMKVDNEEEDEEIELSLDLSMNGRFGVDPIAKKIKRTTSIPEFTNPMKIREHVQQMNNNWSTNLIRTCSLLSETEEEWKRRKEMQTLRRMEAKRKRSEKQRNLKAMKERNRGCGGGGSSEEMIGLEEGGGGRSGADEFNNLRRTTSLTTKVSRLGLNGLPPPSPSPPPVSIGSSQGTPGSSVISETESEQGLGTKPADARNPIDGYSSPESEQKSPAKMLQNHQSSSENRTEDTGRNLLEDMPCVSTKGDGPNGKKIDGFLQYGKGEEVRIVCVCHRSVLTPAEFIKHAGGGEVAKPLKHIIVSPSML